MVAQAAPIPTGHDWVLRRVIKNELITEGVITAENFASGVGDDAVKDLQVQSLDVNDVLHSGSLKSTPGALLEEGRLPKSKSTGDKTVFGSLRQYSKSTYKNAKVVGTKIRKAMESLMPDNHPGWPGGTFESRGTRRTRPNPMMPK